MTTLTDAKLATLETLTGNTGHVQDLEREYLLQLVTGPVVANTIDDLWFQVFDEASIPAGQFNDRFYAYMDSILAPATQDHYNDRRQEYWEGGATPLGPLLLPALANLSHHWDATDLAPQQTFADAAGTILATPGGLMERINDKGLNALFVSEVGTSVPFWSTVANGVNGLQVISTPVSGFFPAAVASAGWGAGMSFAIIEKQNSGVGTQVPFAYDGADLNHQAVQPTIGWRTRIPGIGFVNTGKPVVLGEWVWHYFTVDAAGNFRIRSAGAVEVTGSGVYVPMTGGGVISFVNGPFDVPEIMLWNRALTVPESNQFIAYVDGRYGTMPF